MNPTDATRGTTGRTAAPRRVFLSHTSDLGKPDEPGSFVAAAVAAVLRARHAVTDMAYFAARDTSPAATCIDMVAQSDVYIGVIGLRYGSPVRDRPDVSYTELEFEAAGDHDLPRLMFLVREDSTHVAPADRHVRLDAFRRRRLNSGLTVVRVGSPAELELAIYQALVELGPMPDAPARLAEAQALLASMPTTGTTHAGSRKRGAGGAGFGAQLRRHRLDANLTQEALAARSGVTAQAISLLERGGRQSPRRDTMVRLGRALRLSSSQMEGFLATGEANRPASDSMEPVVTDGVPERGPLPAGSHMLLAPNPLFVGRGDELRQVAAALKGGDSTVALGQVVASTGLGGLGKTQLAVELVHRYGRYFAGGVFWLSFASADDVPLQVAACAGPDAMNLASGIESLPLEERVKRVQRAWQSAVPRLLVFDNCEEEALLEAWRPPSGGCRVLVTSRRSNWSPTLGVSALPLDLLARADSIELLRRYRPDLAPDDDGLDALAAELGNLPLALHLAGTYLRAYRAEVGLDEYMAELQRSDVIEHASLLGAGLDDSPSPTHHVQSVAETFALCLGRLDRDREVDRVAIALLARMACMAPGEPVPRDLLSRALEEVEPRRRADGLRRLGSVGLVEEGEGWLRLHRLLVHFVRRDGLEPEAQPAVARALIGCGKDAEQGHLTGPALAAVVPHLVAVAGETDGPKDEWRAAEMCTAAGRVLRRAGDLRTARPWYERALAIWERVLGLDHPNTAEGLNNLAQLLHDQGELAAARPLYERALVIRERVFGPEHPATAEGLNNLGALLHDQGELAAARPLYERALKVRERVLGDDHPATAESVNDLGALLRDQGQLAAARPLYQRALAIWARALRSDHPDTAFSVNGLGVVLQAQGELDAARPLYERALNVRERVLGPDHPHTAISLHSLALLLQAQGDPAAARLLFERALAIRERVLGPDHPDTVATRRALAEDGGPAAGG